MGRANQLQNQSDKESHGKREQCPDTIYTLVEI